MFATASIFNSELSGLSGCNGRAHLCINCAAEQINRSLRKLGPGCRIKDCLPQVVAQLAHNRVGRSDRGDQSEPAAGTEAWKCLRRRLAGPESRLPLGRAHSERPDGSSLQRARQRRIGVDDHRDATTDDVVERLRGAAEIGDHEKLDAGTLLQRFTGEMEGSVPRPVAA